MFLMNSLSKRTKWENGFIKKSMTINLSVQFAFRLKVISSSTLDSGHKEQSFYLDLWFSSGTVQRREANNLLFKLKVNFHIDISVERRLPTENLASCKETFKESNQHGIIIIIIIIIVINIFNIYTNSVSWCSLIACGLVPYWAWPSLPPAFVLFFFFKLLSLFGFIICIIYTEESQRKWSIKWMPNS